MLTAQYIIEFTKLYIITSYIARFNKTGSIKRPNQIAVLGLFIIDICRFIYYGKIIEYNYDTYLCGFLSIFLIFLGFRGLNRLLILFGLYIIICFIDMLVAGLIMTSLSLNIATVPATPVYKLLLNSITIILFLGIGHIIKFFNVNFRLEFMHRKDVYFLIIEIIGSGFCVAALQVYANNSNNLPDERLIIVAICIAGFALVAITAIFILKNNHLKYLKELQKVQEQLPSAQLSYYSRCLQQENETRKFLHDINEHLYCISYLLKSAKYDELQTYVENITGIFTEIKEKSEIQTGSDLINIVLSDLTNQYSAQDISLSWHGQIPDTRMESSDLCGLFSNLLKNAFEAAVLCPDKRIEVSTNQQEHGAFIRISNTCSSPVKIVDNILITTKPNPSKHGYGSQIIRDIVNKYNGQIQYYYENQLFSIDITFLNICRTDPA